MRQTGTVLSFQLNRHFGFINTDLGQSLFFHIKNVRDGYVLAPNDIVEFDVAPSLKAAGKLECFDVTLIERAEKPLVADALAQQKAVQS